MFLTTEQLWIVTSACSIRSEGEAASHACSNSSQDRGDGFLQVGTAQIACRGKRRPGRWRVLWPPRIGGCLSRVILQMPSAASVP
jgi:hypothetical protein